HIRILVGVSLGGKRPGFRVNIDDSVSRYGTISQVKCDGIADLNLLGLHVLVHNHHASHMVVGFHTSAHDCVNIISHDFGDDHGRSHGHDRQYHQDGKNIADSRNYFNHILLTSFLLCWLNHLVPIVGLHADLVVGKEVR